MNNTIKVGDLVETCSLMPGVIMKRKGDDIEVRMLEYDEYQGENFSGCSLMHCGIKKLNAYQTMNRLIVGKEKLSELYSKPYSTWEDYDKAVTNLALTL